MVSTYCPDIRYLISRGQGEGRLGFSVKSLVKPARWYLVCILDLSNAEP
jgi:hypothetical protein